MMSTVMTQGLEKMLFLYHSQFFQQKVFLEKLTTQGNLLLANKLCIDGYPHHNCLLFGYSQFCCCVDVSMEEDEVRLIPVGRGACWFQLVFLLKNLKVFLFCFLVPSWCSQSLSHIIATRTKFYEYFKLIADLLKLGCVKSVWKHVFWKVTEKYLLGAVLPVQYFFHGYDSLEISSHSVNICKS